MLTPLRSAGLAALVAIVAACSGSVSGGSFSASVSPTSPPTSSPSAAPTSTPGAAGAIEHATGATDEVLRYEQGGGFVAPAFLATQVPIFTLYGDGTVIFRNPAEAPPAPVGDIYRPGPLRIARLSEDQIQSTLVMALSAGGLGAARANYTNDRVADASTAVFTINVGGVSKTVSVYALGIEVDGLSDALPRAAFAKLAERLGNFDQNGTIPTQAYVPDRYRGILQDGFSGGPGAKPWPWKEIRPSDFVVPTDPNAFQLPAKVLTVAQVEAFGGDLYQGGFQGLTLLGPGDGKVYSFSLRPLLPDERE